MAINWTAVAVGFVITLVIGVVAGVGIPMMELTLPAMGWVVTGLVGGAAAGYLAGGDATNGAAHGILGTTIGSIVVVGILAIAGTLVLGLVGLSVFLVPLLMLGLYAIPGAVGGAVGAVFKGTRTAEVGQPAGR